jgi:plastocyanin
MRQVTFALALAVLLLTTGAQATTYTVVDQGFSFSPSTLAINLGDTVVFNLAMIHTVVEVSQATWNINGNTSNGGFSLPYGGGTLVLTNTGTYYYVCGPHASMGMKGTITVSQTTLATGSIAPATYCRGGSLSVPFTAGGSYTAGNQFTAQLSSAAGSFSSPTVIGTLSGTTSGQISATIPVSTPAGTGYRVRVISSNPALIATDNGANITVLDAPSAVITPGGPTSFCEGSNVTLAANTGTGLTYAWRRNGGVISNATSSSYLATTAGSYTVEVSNGSCSTLSGIERVVVYASDPTTLTWTGAMSTDWNTVGNWDNPCAVPTPGDTIVIGASAAPPTNMPSLTLARLVLNNATGLSLAGDLTITGTLQLTNGSITLGAANLSIAGGGSISGGSGASFVVTNGSGELRQAGIGSGGRTGTVLFPLGFTALDYTPLQLANTGTADEFRVAVRDAVREDGTTGTIVSEHVVARTWLVSEATPGGSNATLTAQWNAPNEQPSFDRTSCFLAHYDGGAWTALQSSGSATGSGPFQRSASGVTTFSPFAVGDASSPLPVELRSLHADVEDGAVMLRWVTERETNSAGFDVERSATRSGPWTSVTFIPGAGTSTGARSYSHLDRPPAAGTWLYRLRLVDLDGTSTHSDIVQATIDAAVTRLAIDAAYPDPVRLSQGGVSTLSFTSPLGGRALLAVYDILGRRVATLLDGPVEAGHLYNLRFDASALPAGAYVYRLDQGTQTVARRLTVLR